MMRYFEPPDHCKRQSLLKTKLERSFAGGFVALEYLDVVCAEMVLST